MHGEGDFAQVTLQLAPVGAVSYVRARGPAFELEFKLILHPGLPCACRTFLICRANCWGLSVSLQSISYADLIVCRSCGSSSLLQSRPVEQTIMPRLALGNLRLGR